MRMRGSTRALAVFLFPCALMAQRPWQQITAPSVREAAANFKTPPREYGAIHWAIWGGALTKERIVSEFDSLQANGVYIVNFGPAQRMTPPYFSPEHLALTKFAVEEAAKRGMKVWLADEGSYPSGFAGGKISKEYPQLSMQGLVADIRIRVAPGQRLSAPVPPDTLAIMALVTSPDQQVEGIIPIPLPSNGQLNWTVPSESATPNQPRPPREVVFVRHIFLSSPTRYINREDGTQAKDGLYSLIDYLNPDATRAFLKTTHEVYKGLFGGEFGKTVLGFFGDEPAYSTLPWTPTLPDEFQKQKGYDLKPYIPLFFAGNPTEETQRARADYYDVWSGIFRDTFYGVQADWCARNNLEYLVHQAGEESMMLLVRIEGDFFRGMRHVQVPGIDNLNQLVPSAIHTPDGTWNVNNNFPKLASSAAHLFGTPKVWAEGGGGPGVDGKFQLDFQLVRGVNALQIRIPVGAAPMPPQAPMLAWYTNRAGYLMAIGRPAAQVGLYHPANSMWMGDQEADRGTTKLGWQLLEHQVDWDYFDEQSLSSVATIADGGFKNLSGQVYRAIVVPPSTVITRTGLERFQSFVKAGGTLIFVGKTPTLVVDKTFRDSKGAPDLSFATLIEPAGDITPRVLAALPKPDVKLDAGFPRLTYTHRSWRDADLYYFFNESNKAESRMATIAGRGQAQVWDLGTGEIHAISGAAAEGDSVRFALALGPYEAKVVVVGPLLGGVAAPEPSLATGSTLAELGGDWALDLHGKQLTTSLKSWEDLGTQSFAGPATYRKQFTAAAVPAGKRLFLEIADVNDYAKVKLNGKEMEGRAWQSYRWDVTNVVKPGANDLEVEVRTTAGGRGGFGGPPPPTPAAAPGAAAGGRSGGRGRGAAPPPVSGLLGPVRLVAH